MSVSMEEAGVKSGSSSTDESVPAKLLPEEIEWCSPHSSSSLPSSSESPIRKFSSVDIHIVFSANSDKRKWEILPQTLTRVRLAGRSK